MEQKGIWLTLMDYAAYRSISVSTVRRYIKAGRVKSKIDNGKYLIFVLDDNFKRKAIDEEKEILELKLENQRLKTELRRYISEVEDLKTLLMAYENTPSLPQIPQVDHHENT